MPSDLTIIISKAGAPLASSALAPTHPRPAEALPPERLAQISQVVATEARTTLKSSRDNPNIQIPKRAEPTYTRAKRKKGDKEQKGSATTDALEGKEDEKQENGGLDVEA